MAPQPLQCDGRCATSLNREACPGLSRDHDFQSDRSFRVGEGVSTRRRKSGNFGAPVLAGEKWPPVVSALSTCHHCFPVMGQRAHCLRDLTKAENIGAHRAGWGTGYPRLPNFHISLMAFSIPSWAQPYSCVEFHTDDAAVSTPCRL